MNEMNEITKGMSNAAEKINENFGMLSIESGSNSNGTWIKFHDGTQICTHEITLNTAISTAIGSAYAASPTSHTWNFPTSFIQAPFVDGKSTDFHMTGTINQYLNETRLIYRPYHFVSSDARDHTIKFFAIGRWK